MAKEEKKNPLNWAAPTEGEAVQTGFPAYWSPEEGGRFMGVVCAKDDSDPDFVRFYLLASRPIQAFRGKDREESVIVQPGDYFSVGDYTSLGLGNYVGSEIYVEVDKKVATSNGKRSVWTFKNVKVTRRNVQLPPVSFARRSLPESDTNGNTGDVIT